MLEVQKNAILCLNLMDEAAKKGIEIDVAALERELGIPVIPCAARQGKGLHELEAAIRRAAAGENETHPTAIRYPAMDEDLTEEAEGRYCNRSGGTPRGGDRADVRQTAGMRLRAG